ncbi:MULTISPECIES: glycosyltransferase family 2 protein [Ramlibacter]|uniref:Glycosyltransferase family 2 protein n=1 Tax=Ramlibacter aquaticus TaxID=2780094 RepID=A0ABR9SFC5_9BURK|nr:MULTISPECIES: glycosyltransferase family 2 protein [Ramlibacter]MBE7941049.1 glycosyltransferase family 2 protein [Ramlibacter aquaticus]
MTQNPPRSTDPHVPLPGEDGLLPERGTPTLSCVIPCHNEAQNLELLLPRLAELLPTLSRAWEVVLVDDGSRDATAAVIARWARQPGFVGRVLSRNFGKEAAITAGLEAAAGEVVVIMDADLQHPPSLIEPMLAHWREGADVVYAVRSHRDDEAWVKRVGTGVFYRLLNAFDRFEVPEGAGDFRLMDRGAVDALLQLPERNRFMKGLYAWVGFRAVPLPYVPEARVHGRSSFSFKRLLNLSLAGLTSFTTWPLRIVSVVGLLVALVGFLYGGFLIIQYLLWGNEVSGWTTIVVTLMLFLGLQMVFLGIIGEYVGRIFEEVKGRPLYVVHRALGRGLGRREP